MVCGKETPKDLKVLSTGIGAAHQIGLYKKYKI